MAPKKDDKKKEAPKKAGSGGGKAKKKVRAHYELPPSCFSYSCCCHVTSGLVLAFAFSVLAVPVPCLLPGLSCAEVEQGQGQGEARQSGLVRQDHLREDALGRAKAEAHHPLNNI